MDIEDRIKTGWGAADITPRGGKISLVGQWHERITDIIRDPIMANAMVLQTSRGRTIWVACDLCAVSKPLYDETKRLLRASLPGFNDDELILSATHIHTGPGTDNNPFLRLLNRDSPNAIQTEECRRQAALGIERAVRDAVESLAETRFEIAVSYTITGVNRRVSYKNGTGAMYGDITKPDFSGMEGRDGGPIQILYARRASDGEMTGVIAAVPCTAQADENADYVTADYWAAARGVIKNKFGSHVVALGLIRSSGDLSPHTRVDGGKLIEPISGEKGAVEMGKRIGDAVVRAAGEIITSYGPEAAYKHMKITEPLPFWTADKNEYEAAKKFVSAADTNNLESLSDRMAHSNANAKIMRYESGITEYSADFHALRIGDVVFITNPFEMYIEYADRIRAACPDAQIIDVQLAGDDCLGYLPTQKAINAGGYSTMMFNCFFNAEGGDAVVEKSVGLIKSIMK